MIRPPAQVDSLMWAVAEKRDPQAIADFTERFPHLQGELTKRIRMVERFKGARVPAAMSIPAFRVQVHPKPHLTPKWVIGGVSLASLAVASYVVTASLSKPEPAPEEVGTIIQRPAPSRERGRRHVVRPILGEREGMMVRSLPRPDETEKGPDGTEKAESTPPLPAQQRPFSIHVQRATLKTIIEAVCEQAELKVIIAPGMLNPEIRIDYENTSPTSILQDLGARYGFTAFDEGGGTLLVIPAIDKQKGSGGYSPAQDEDRRRPTG